jgi:hypothetical protein
MGNDNSVLTSTELENYSDCTFFTKKEILHVHKRFRQLKANTTQDRVPKDRIKQLPELKVSFSLPHPLFGLFSLSRILAVRFPFLVLRCSVHACFCGP